jgi:hypothetical protein
VNGQNKLVPSVSFAVANSGADTLSALQVYAVFRLAGETEELGSSLVILRGEDALKPSGRSKPMTMRANWGFTSDAPRGQMLSHRLFQDARVQIFAKHGSAPFVKLVDAQVARQLLTK